MSSRNTWIGLGTALGVTGLAGGALLYSRRASAAQGPVLSGAPDPGTAPGSDFLPLPTAADVKGDLSRNWGEIPFDLRALLLLMEEASQIPGSGRVFGVIAYRESRYVTTAHNGNAANEEDERDGSRRAYKNNKDRNPALRFGDQAAEFGSGGLFGALAPYFLWTGVPEVGAKAPLLNAPPEIVFQPRAASFGAAVYMQRILKHYRVDDIADIKAGWANPSFLTTGRGSESYKNVRSRFIADVEAVGIDLNDATIPAKLNASAWPGVPAVFARLVGKGLV